MSFSPLKVSTAALRSAPPISAFTCIDGSLISTAEVAFEDQCSFRTKTDDTLLAGAVLGGLCSRPRRSLVKCSFLFGQFWE